MIIDFHAHARRDQGDPANLINAMDENGVDLMVLHPIVPTAAGVGESSNEFIAELVARYPDRFAAFACVQPLEESAPEELKRLVETYGFKGLKLHPPIQQFELSNSAIYPTLRMAEQLELPVLIHTGPIFPRGARLAYGDPLPADDLAYIFPDLDIIIAHADPFGHQPTIAGRHPRVYTDTAVVFTRFARLIPGVGEDMLDWMSIGGQPGYTKLLFGTDANPRNTLRLSQTIDAIKAMDIDDEQKAAILGGTAQKLLRL